MPIGKNSIKRVANNGYSNVKTTAPDMENSTEISVATKKKAAAPAQKKVAAPAQKKAAASAPKATAAKKETAKKADSADTKAAAPTKDGFCYYGIGTELPIHLL